MPPSPWLSARITKNRYFTEMIITRAQKASEPTPNTFVLLTSSTWVCSVNASRSE